MSANKIKRLIGATLMFGFNGTTVTKQVETLITKHHIGGIILFARNIKNQSQLKKLCRDLQKTRKKVSDTPLFIAIDQECGAVSRLIDPLFSFPGNMALGATGDKKLAYQQGKAVGTALLNCGINVNLAPVLDINNNPDNPGIGVRSFGDKTSAVSAMGANTIKGYQWAKISACAKHFPGKGDAAQDAHLALPSINVSTAKMHKRELMPFKEAIKNKTDMIMVSHVLYPACDKKNPATLSHKIITGLLKEKMGYKGLVVTDDMEMKAIADNYGIEKAALISLKAGSDIVLVCHTYKEQLKTLKFLYQNFIDGVLDKEIIEEKYKKIKKLQQKYSKKTKAVKNNISNSKKLSRKIAESSITLIRNKNKLIPLNNLKDKTLCVITPQISSLTLVEEGKNNADVFLKTLRRKKKEFTCLEIPAKPTTAITKATLKKVKELNPDILIVLSYNAHLLPEQALFLQKITAEKEDTIVASIRNPYDLKTIPDIKTYLTSYSFRDSSLKALAEVILGDIPALGSLPVKSCM